MNAEHMLYNDLLDYFEKFQVGWTAAEVATHGVPFMIFFTAGIFQLTSAMWRAF